MEGSTIGQILHGMCRARFSSSGRKSRRLATTTEAIRRAIQNSEESLRALSARYGINQKTVAKWRNRTSVADLPTGPKDAKSTALTLDEEAMIAAFGRHTLLPLDDCLYSLQPSIPHLTRSSLRKMIPGSFSDLRDCTAVCSGTISADCPRSMATSLRRRNSRPTRSATFTLILLRFRRPKYEEDQKTVRGTVFPTIGCISSSQSTAPPGLPS